MFGLCGVVSAGQEFFPFLAEVTRNQVNVRSGQSTNFERVCQLDKGEKVVVIGKEFSWYKIQLPPSAKIFVSKDYVQFLGRNAGGITADRVNIRAAAGIHSTVLGHLIKGEQIFIQEKLDKWYRIQPVRTSYGWVADRFLAFKSKDISQHQLKLSAKLSVKKSPRAPKSDSKKNIPGGKAPDINSSPMDEKIHSSTAPRKNNFLNRFFGQKPVEEKLSDEETVEEVVEVKGTRIFSAIGYVESHKDRKNDDIRYKIVSNGKPVCYVQGVNQMLSRFQHQRVAVAGIVNQKLQSRYACPVITVSRIRLMF